LRRASDNPFAVHRVLRERYRLDESGWGALLARLEAQGHRGAIVGSHGSGKTTLLEDLASRLDRAGRTVTLLRFDSTERSLGSGSRYGADDFVLVDGAEQLGWWDWQQLRRRARRAGGFVVTSHRDGLLPLLHRCETSPELLGALADSLGEPLPAEDAMALYRRHLGNVREALRELYDHWSSGRIHSCCVTRTAFELEAKARGGQEKR
jgi:hypothetical protein